MNLLREALQIISPGQGRPNFTAGIAYTPIPKWDPSLIDDMTDRIAIEVVKIRELEEEPSMDRARIAGIAVLNGEDWKFRTNLEHLGLGDEIRAIVERTEDEDGQYIRIHETLGARNNGYV